VNKSVSLSTIIIGIIAVDITDITTCFACKHL
jgi:hypothetical protein